MAIQDLMARPVRRAWICSINKPSWSLFFDLLNAYGAQPFDRHAEPLRGLSSILEDASFDGRTLSQ
jgi:hypothetical protein